MKKSIALLLISMFLFTACGEASSTSVTVNEPDLSQVKAAAHYDDEDEEYDENDNSDNSYIEDTEDEYYEEDVDEDVESDSLPAPIDYTSKGTPIISSSDFNDVLDQRFDYYDVDSSCFSTIGYDADDSILYVQFLDSGSEYLYLDFPEDEFNSLLYADSIGHYYTENIKGLYDSERIE